MEFTGEFCVPGKTPKRILDDHVERYRFAAKFVKNETVLDIACGVGYGSRLMADSGARSVTGVDISREVIDYARMTYAHENLDFLQSDILEFAAKDRFDVVVCFETIEHIENFKSALSVFFDCLKPGGTLVISSPNRIIASPEAKSVKDKPCNIFHVREFLVNEFVKELKNVGFQVSRSDVYGQRKQIPVSNRYLRKYYKKIFRPDETSSPVVTRLRFFSPRYFIVVASKS